MSAKLRSPQMVKKKGKICAENAQRSGVLQRRVPRNHGLSPCPAQISPRLIRRPVSRVLSTINWIGDHSSGMMIAHHLARPTRKAMRRHMKCFPYLVLLRTGFTLPDLLPDPRCALTAPFHPYRTVAGEPAKAGGLLSVALSLGSRRAGVTRRPVFMEPGLSSIPGEPGTAAARPSDQNASLPHFKWKRYSPESYA